MTANYYHSIDELDDLEEEALECTPSQRDHALQIVSGVLNRNHVDYGVIGGTNFYLRGSPRTTTDVDIAVSGEWSLASVLDLLGDDERVTRPAPERPLLWVSGVARVFISVSHDQLVQVDIKIQNTATHNFEDETEVIPLSRPVSSQPSSPSEVDNEIVNVRFFQVGPLVRLKLHAHYIREENKDYHDLRFACMDERYGPLVKAASDDYPWEERGLFLEKVLENNPEDELIIRDVMDMGED